MNISLNTFSAGRNPKQENANEFSIETKYSDKFRRYCSPKRLRHGGHKYVSVIGRLVKDYFIVRKIIPK